MGLPVIQHSVRMLKKLIPVGKSRKRLAETAAEADRRANEAQIAVTKATEIKDKAQQDGAVKEARRLAYFALAKQQWEDMEAQKADSQKANLFDDENFDIESNDLIHDKHNITTTSRPSFSRKREVNTVAFHRSVGGS
jgi:hypothetical protein